MCTGTISTRAVVMAVLCSCLIGCQSRAHGGLYFNAPGAASPLPQQQRLVYYAPPQQHVLRQQRSIYAIGGVGGGGWSGGGGGWNGGGGLAAAPVGLNHISKDELIALLEAWKEVEAGADKPEPEPEPEPERDPEPEPPKQPEPEAPKLPPPGVPLTVSLPAFVPIQLQAMYTAPVPAGEGGGNGNGGGGGGGAGAGAEGGQGGAAPEPEAEEPEEQAPPAKDLHQTLLKLWAPQPRPPTTIILSHIGGGGASKKGAANGGKGLIKSSKPRSHGPILHHAGSAPRIYSAPPPPFLSHAPGPLKLVPSSQLLSNWH